ncbi:MAG: bifunctional [glutamate--ammonia ligase]-adenylyl-L-tyrosine phosphorylase/[glutamate--ammonia-ligase] adenylyltransferase [Methylovulum sp.]|uniref:bifunctional [glutamate--ammonia ligase]-adenylyl-L-tyrosine phosphorylase/[glutamate--ammonia-ligase] adenylyltransferase n=1 Tax=Methylovulum sp. TaxID=1916980 RepID=UPI00261B24CB|nr:bifunctional [glutamate--ammonia ligase]-adenylyl-L-tyrosine phosphorylase/[glutamate--ammonia-ligase] adenylyltransferase [Methylovulum sp.]MDD2723015.1 bifunctional [glutamate--ammonia ligase]-adenylyl-L-tyrosine phosphorylase/[glutamate--ammonia-ligase] adenylyltransferase [Methylovulum sp.]MDD5125225.1 bifunctional [glutamate--ammonia ligase]-adenylyl-L-tyrosine phosphorylase/[glutamate--ammonia-ligase] adenylyltransferase [Methylovulum sp.]
MPLNKSLQSELQNLPDSLRETIAPLLQQWQEKLGQLNLDIPTSPELTSLPKVWAGSQFIAETCLRQPELLLDLIATGDLSTPYAESSFNEKLQLLAISDEAELMRQLRHNRRREMVRIAWRDLAGWAQLSETLMDLSRLADACIQFALDFLYTQACAKRGAPLLPDGSPQQLIVLGMGKLGAYELNYSSDIDLIFAYPEEGVLPDRKATSYGEFFTRLCQSLVKVLDEITVDGFVFRTDIRLRPYGDSGAVIMTFDGMEHYYLTQAREWERYAMIKARQVAGDFTMGAQLMGMLRAFVYRRYLDYGAFEELRSLKAQITQELRRKDRLDNVKLGAGGIREVEFIGQAFQLIRGGTEKSLQQRGILDILKRLGELNLLTPADTEQLISSYGFLRRVENHIQQYQDKQCHDLPTNPTAQTSLAYSLDFSDWNHFKTALDSVRSQVHSVFEQVFSLSKPESSDSHGLHIWSENADEADLLEQLGQCGFTRPQASLTAIRQFKQAAPIKRLSAKGAAVLDRLMPLLLDALPVQTHPDQTLKRVLTLFEAVAGRAVYLSLLAENPDALAQLLRLISASAWLSDYLARYPILFDELLDPRTLFAPLQKQDLDAQLAILLTPIDNQDLEALMTVLRQFKQQQVLKVAAADIMGVVPLMVVSDYLTYIAESVVGQVVKRAWLMLTEKHGFPPVSQESGEVSPGFAVLGLGKFGGIELGYGSDLDLVFICDYADGLAMTDGAKPLSCTQFYGRLGQKIRHILDTKLLSGILYEIDMRLRPNGDSGLLVTHINTYEDYLRNQAWTWEHQALVRGRFIAGDTRLQTGFEKLRHAILGLPRNLENLRAEVRDMREKMRLALVNNELGKFDLKQGNGGIADIEFIVQFLILAHAANHPALTVYTDNIRLLENLGSQGLLPETTVTTLKTAYCEYRDLGHKLALQDSLALVDEREVAELKQSVGHIWDQVLIFP